MLRSCFNKFYSKRCQVLTFYVKTSGRPFLPGENKQTQPQNTPVLFSQNAFPSLIYKKKHRLMNTEVFLVPAPSKGYENVGWTRLGKGGIPLHPKIFSYWRCRQIEIFGTFAAHSYLLLLKIPKYLKKENGTFGHMHTHCPITSALHGHVASPASLINV